MRDFLGKLFKLEAHEFSMVALFGFALFANSLAQQISEISSVSGFLGSNNVNQMIIVWMIDAVIIFLMMGAQSITIDRYDRRKLTQWVLIIFSVFFILMRVLFWIGAPDWLNYGVLYLISEQQWLFFPVIIWALANDTFNIAEAKRVFPIISSGDFIGKLAGIGIAALAPTLTKLTNLRLEDTLLLNAIIYFAAFLVFTASLKKIQIRQTSQVHQNVGDTLKEGWDFIKEVKVFRYLAIMILLVLIADTLIEFRFLVITDSLFASDTGRFQLFYSLYRLGTILLSLLIQALLTNRIIKASPLKNLFFVEPIGATVGSIIAFVFTGLGGALGSISLMKIPQITIGDSIRKAFQSLVPEERRGRVSIFMDSYLFSAGTFIGCLLAGGGILLSQLLPVPDYFVFLGMAIIISIASILTAINIHKYYDESMFNWRLRRRQRGKSILDKLEF